MSGTDRRTRTLEISERDAAHLVSATGHKHGRYFQCSSCAFATASLSEVAMHVVTNQRPASGR